MLNETRVSLVRDLKKHFPNRFVGGLQSTKYASDNFKDLLADFDNDRKSFIVICHNNWPGVATDYLHQSMGWKLPEYIASSMCVSTHRLKYEIPEILGDENIMTFMTNDEYMENCDYLFSNKNFSSQMRINNHVYYNKYNRPDSLIMNRSYEVFQ